MCSVVWAQGGVHSALLTGPGQCLVTAQVHCTSLCTANTFFIQCNVLNKKCTVHSAHYLVNSAQLLLQSAMFSMKSAKVYSAQLSLHSALISMNSGIICGKAEAVVWWICPKGGSKGNQTVLRGVAPKDSLITWGTSWGTDSPHYPQGFSTDCHSFGIPQVLIGTNMYPRVQCGESVCQ